MTATETVARVLESGLIKRGLMHIPGRGATKQELEALSRKLVRPLSDAHSTLLMRWNGINLDVVRIYAVTPVPGELRGLEEVQAGPLTEIRGAIVFGDDPSGFVYAESLDGTIISLDSSFGTVSVVAEDLDSFFGRLVFGIDAAKFAGDDWFDEVKQAGLI